MEKRINRWIYWIPRILSIIFILFLVLMSLDIFDLGLGFWGTILGLVMHNIPTLILLIILFISWKHELVGGITYILIGLIYLIMMFTNQSWNALLSSSLIIYGPAFIIGILFIINWIKKKKLKKKLLWQKLENYKRK